MRGFGTIYRQRKSRFFWMQYFVAGQRFRESTRCDRQKDAQQVLKNKLLDIQQSAPSEGHNAPATIAGLYAIIEADYEMNGRKSLPHLRILWKNHLEPFFAAIATTKLSSDQIVEYACRRRADGAANASINRELAALKRMYKLAVKSGRLKLVPYIAMLKERNVRKGFVRDGEYRTLVWEMANVPWLRAMFELAYTYGWRKSELTTMRVSQVNIAEGTIELNPGETKNDEARGAQMTSGVRELLIQCIDGKTADDLVFTRANGKPVGNFRRTWAKVCRAAGVPGLLFHDLRRSGVRNMRRDGISEKVAMGISGHKTRSVFERYNIVDPSDLREAAVKLEQGVERRARGEAVAEPIVSSPSPPGAAGSGEGVLGGV
jgi:integrase